MRLRKTLSLSKGLKPSAEDLPLIYGVHIQPTINDLDQPHNLACPILGLISHLLPRVIFAMDLFKVVNGDPGVDLGGFQGFMTEHLLDMPYRSAVP